VSPGLVRLLREKMSKREPSGNAQAAVHVSDGQGVLVGTGGTQVNNWGQRPPLDPSWLSALNPHAAVARLQQLTHDDLVDFFARATPDDAGEILGFFLQSDEPKVVAVLGDINRRKAMQLIGPITVPGSYLAELPEASEAIARKAAQLRWTDAGPMLRFSEGYGRKYKAGHVFHAVGIGTFATLGAIDEYCTANDFRFGLPTGNDITTPSSLLGPGNARQSFESGTVYSSFRGTFFVQGVADERYTDEGGIDSWLGFPTGEADVSSFATSQDFKNGTIYSYMDDGPESFAVRPDVKQAVAGIREFRPVSVEVGVVSSTGTKGSVQHFQVQRKSGICSTAVYTSQTYGAVGVELGIWGYYSNLGEEKSWLGFPAKPGKGLSLPGCGVQYFEEGLIYWQPEKNPIAVSLAIISWIAKDNAIRGRLGFPVSEEGPAGADGSGRIQFFEKGVVTLRDGEREAWLRPDSKAESPVEPDITSTT
jgi:uncharacterized protein with LGFP repeats